MNEIKSFFTGGPYDGEIFVFPCPHPLSQGEVDFIKSQPIQRQPSVGCKCEYRFESEKPDGTWVFSFAGYCIRDGEAQDMLVLALFSLIDLTPESDRTVSMYEDAIGCLSQWCRDYGIPYPQDDRFFLDQIMEFYKVDFWESE